MGVPRRSGEEHEPTLCRHLAADPAARLTMSRPAGPPPIVMVPWPAPLPIPSGLPSVPAFDGHLLPAALAPWVEDIAERAQCPPDFVAVGALVLAAAVIGRQVAIRPKRADDCAESEA